MPSPLPRLLLRPFVSLLLILTSTTPSAQTPPSPAAPIPLEDFFENPLFSGALLSPDGRHIAVKVAAKTGRVRLMSVDLTNMKTAALASFDDADIDRFLWVNDNRVALTVSDNDLAQGDLRFGPGLYAVNADGTEFRQLVSRVSGFLQVDPTLHQLLPWDTHLKQAIGPQTGDDVYVTQPKYNSRYQLDSMALLRLNTLTGQAHPVQRPEAAMDWLIDPSGVPRVVESDEKGTSTIYYKATANDEWQPLTSFNTYGVNVGAFVPDAFAPDGTLFVRAGWRGKDALFTYDLKHRKLAAEPIVSMADYDFDGHLIMSEHAVLGVSYESDARTTLWFDPKMKAMQAAIDQALPHAVNTLTVPRRAATPYVLVHSYSDLQPSRYLLYNTATKQLSQLGSSHPAIDPSRMSPMQMVHYKARDGLNIPAYLTLPRGSTGKNLPLVVFVHGGPYLRGGHWEWDPEVQFLASRGYAVLQPDYRGSTGYGVAHLEAGFKQWGLKMQDDIADGARWAIAQGIAAPQRVCIAGASYGGYATLMGLINDAALYRCGVDWAGVTDLTLLHNSRWSDDSDLSTAYKQYGFPLMVGDPEKDAAQFRATSPIYQAARITQPLLLAYGGADRRVPLSHGTLFYDAVQRTNPHVEWVVYDEEGHGWALPKNRVDFWGRVEKFLERNIGH